MPRGLLLPVGSGRFDVVAFQFVTWAIPLANVSRSLNAVHDYSEATLRTAWRCRLAEGRGGTFCTRISAGETRAERRARFRFSWGYPAIPSFLTTVKCSACCGGKCGGNCRLSSAYQLVPEQSTAAIIVHHPWQNTLTLE